MNSLQINWILEQIKSRGFLPFDDCRLYFEDGKLSARHLKSIQKSIKYLKKEGWIKERKGSLVFTRLGRFSWTLARLPPALTKLLLKKEIKMLLPKWNVWRGK